MPAGEIDIEVQPAEAAACLHHLRGVTRVRRALDEDRVDVVGVLRLLLDVRVLESGAGPHEHARQAVGEVGALAGELLHELRVGALIDVAKEIRMARWKRCRRKSAVGDRCAAREREDTHRAGQHGERGHIDERHIREACLVESGEDVRTECGLRPCVGLRKLTHSALQERSHRTRQRVVHRCKRASDHIVGKMAQITLLEVKHAIDEDEQGCGPVCLVLFNVSARAFKQTWRQFACGPRERRSPQRGEICASPCLILSAGPLQRRQSNGGLLSQRADQSARRSLYCSRADCRGQPFICATQCLHVSHCTHHAHSSS
mmetsp:Transcript_40804/g.87029  ORF Transcript_40804/g.87029 Transcript_40804/m.87029 type:complete len:317 (+) Transcript_40804:1189-2139(+)